MTTPRTYDAQTVDIWLDIHLNDLLRQEALLTKNIERETSLRLRTIDESRRIEVQSEIKMFRHLIAKIKQHGPRGLGDQA